MLRQFALYSSSRECGCSCSAAPRLHLWIAFHHYARQGLIDLIGGVLMALPSKIAHTIQICCRACLDVVYILLEVHDSRLLCSSTTGLGICMPCGRSVIYCDRCATEAFPKVVKTPLRRGRPIAEGVGDDKWCRCWASLRSCSSI